MDSEKTFQKKYKLRRIVWKTLDYAVLIFIAFLFFMPFVFALSTSLTSQYGIYEKGYNWLWHKLDFSNYTRLFREYNIVGGFFNTILYIVPPIVVGVFTSAMAAFGFARMRFPGKSIVFFGLLLTMFIIRQFIMTLPKELEDAAKIDGMGWWGIFLRIALPLSTPILITQLILSFNGAYNDYLGPLIYVGTVDKLKTLQLVLATINTAHHKSYTLMMAGSIVALIPTFILFAAAQKSFIEGIITTGIKG